MVMRQSRKIITLPVIAIMKKLGLYSLYSLRESGPLKEDGWFRSFSEQASIDAEGNPLPWITYPAIDFLKKRVTKEMSVFEYGAGGSTLWWASRVKDVVAVEHDRQWFDKVLKALPANVDLHHVKLEYGGAYCRTVAAYRERFDIVVVDGRDRVNCIKNCLTALKQRGVVILDNSERNEYTEGKKYLQHSGFRSIEFIGACPIVNLKSETSIFYRDNNILSI